MLPMSLFKGKSPIKIEGSRGWRCYLRVVNVASILHRAPGRFHGRRRLQSPAEHHALTDTAARPAANENYLLINAFAPQGRSPLSTLAKRIADAGCNIFETRVAAVGSEVSVLVLAVGPWDAIAKLETALVRVERDDQVRLMHFRTNPKPAQ